MKTKKILYLFLLPLIFTACETKDIPVYTSDDAALYFQRTASYIWGSTTVTYSNSTEFTFAGAAAEKNNVTYSAEVRTMGNVTDYDRPFKVEIDKEMSTGIQGVHFDTNLDTLKIKAGKSNAYVRITFYRTPDLLDSTLTVVLHLIENEHFNARIDEYKKRTNGTPAAKTWTVPGIRSNSTNNIPNRLTGPGSVKVSSVPGRLRNTSLSIRSWAGQ